MKQFLETGKITGTHGLKGEVRVQSWADSPEFMTQFRELYLDRGAKKIEITAARVHKNMLIMKIRGIDSMDEADKLREKVLYISRDDVELDEGTYFIQDLIGLNVLDEDTGERIGRLDDVSETGANDVYHIRTDDGRVYLIPAVPDVVRDISVDDGVMCIFKMKGLFDE